MRDRNLRSGDLHEELGIFLLKAIALVAPVPRQEDIGNDAFATLIRPDGSRRLVPDLSFLVQLKAASITSVRYTTVDEMAWISALEVPLFIGRVSLEAAKIELFATHRLNQILLEQHYDGVVLLLDPADETPSTPTVRRANLGPPVHTWSMSDVADSKLLANSHAILRPHIQILQRNRLLRGIQTQVILQWETGQPPTEGGEMMQISPQQDIANTLRDIAIHTRRLMVELQRRRHYGDFEVMLAFFDLMRRWGVDPDPSGAIRIAAGLMAGGTEISLEDAIRIRHAANPRLLNLQGLGVTNDSLIAIPADATAIALVDSCITDEGIPFLLSLQNLRRLNLAGTRITDAGLEALTKLPSLEWVCVARTQVTVAGTALLRTKRPDVTVMIAGEP